MTERFNRDRPLPQPLHFAAIFAVVSTFLLLILGQMVTSFRAGMSDPVWPTEPWYLFSNYKLDVGYLIEHSHRIAAYTVGGMAIVLALWLWWTEPRKIAKWAALLGLLILVGGFGVFQGKLMAQRNVSPAELHIPMGSVYVTLLGLILILGTALSGLIGGIANSGLRLLGSALLVGVMIQGLLGGFRVKLNELVGTDLAATHGIFAQVVLSLIVLLAVLTERPASVQHLEVPDRSPGRASILLTALVFVQIVWGAMVRHNPNSLMQKLHFLTAFLALAIAVLLLRAVFASRAQRTRAGLASWVLGGLLAFQLYLGVEAWMMKFGAYTLPELVPITAENATIRTIHALVGSGILASSLVLAVRLGRTIGTETSKQNSDDFAWAESSLIQGHEVELAGRLPGNTP